MSRRDRWRSGLAVLITLTGLVAGLSLIFGGASASLERTVIEGLILLSATVGYYAFVGMSGIFSFGHVAFMSIGAYATAIVSLTSDEKSFLLPQLPGALSAITVSPFLACLVGAAVAAIFAAVLAVPIMRLVGMTAALTTFAVLQIVNVVEINLTSVTNGQQGIAGLPSAATLTTTALTAIAAIVVVFVFQQSRWGRRLRAAREDEPAALSLGVGVRFERRVAFVLSAFIVGLSGGLYAQFLAVITPSTFYLSITFLIVAMLVVGGLNSLSGAVIGSITITAVDELLFRVEGGLDLGALTIDGPTGIAQVGLALIMLVILLLRPAGLLGRGEVSCLERPLGWIENRALAILGPVSEREPAGGTKRGAIGKGQDGGTK